MGTSQLRALPAPAVTGLAWLTGSIPFTNIASRRLARVDLRSVGNGTVSGTGLYEVTDLRTLAVVGCLELAKGATGVALAGRDRPRLEASATAAAVIGHNWSPFLRLAGGRGVAPALGATLVAAPEGAALLAGGLAAGKLAGETAIGCLIAAVALPAVLARTRGRDGAALGLAVTVPMVAKRLMGNGPPPAGPLWRTLWNRLLLDRDSASKPALRGGG